MNRPEQLRRRIDAAQPEHKGIRFTEVNEDPSLGFLGPYPNAVYGQAYRLITQVDNPTKLGSLNPFTEFRTEMRELKMFQFASAYHTEVRMVFYAVRKEDIPLHLLCLPPYAIPTNHP